MKNEKEITNRLHSELQNEPLIRDPSKISFLIERKGGLFNKNNYIIVAGKVTNDMEYKKLENILSKEKNNSRVINNVKIESTSI